MILSELTLKPDKVLIDLFTNQGGIER